MSSSYTQLYNTALGAKVADALADSSVVPSSSSRIIFGNIDLDGVASGANGDVLGPDGQPIYLQAGERIIAFQAIQTEVSTSGATYQYGLANTANDSLTAITAVGAANTIEIPKSAGAVSAVAGNDRLVVQVTTAAADDGQADVILHVA